MHICCGCQDEVESPIWVLGSADILGVGTVMHDENQAYCLDCIIEAPVIGPRIKNYVTSAMEKADDTFWEDVAKSFPEAKTGDFLPDDEPHFKAYAMDLIKWLQYNTELLPQESL